MKNVTYITQILLRNIALCLPQVSPFFVNSECDPGNYYWNYNPGKPPSSQTSANHLKIGNSYSSSPNNTLRMRINYMTRYIVPGQLKTKYALKRNTTHYLCLMYIIIISIATFSRINSQLECFMFCDRTRADPNVHLLLHSLLVGLKGLHITQHCMGVEFWCTDPAVYACMQGVTESKACEYVIVFAICTVKSLI